MERLQAALEKARAERAVMGSTKPRPAPQGRPAPATTTVAAWDDLTVGTFDRAHLVRERIAAVGSGPDSNAVDMLRTRVVQLMRQNGWRRVAVTSPDKGAGKSTTSCNLLVSLARQMDRRTILFDLDMRRPALAGIMGIEGEDSLSDVLEGRVPFHRQAVRFSDSAAVAVNARPARNPSEILLSDRSTAILQEIEETYRPDIMIFDMPPMLMTDDTLAFLKNVDCAILVAGAETTTIDQVDICEKDISGQTNMLGVVLNKCRHMEQGYGYDYY